MLSWPSFLRERNLVKKTEGKRFGFLFPSSYDVGMSGMTTLVITHLVSQVPTWRAERFFTPWNPFVEAVSLESGATLRDVDVIGFTTQFEQHYLMAGWLIQKAGIPLDNRKRKRQINNWPLIVVGGPCCMANPLPLIDMVDGYFLGDVEESLPLFLHLLDEYGVEGFRRNPFDFADVKGFWSPHFLDVNNTLYSSLFNDRCFEEMVGGWFERFQFIELNEAPYPLQQIVTELPDYHPYAPVKGRTFQLEIGRGCNHKCRFCMISRLLHKGRYRDYETLRELVFEGTKLSGVTKVDIFGTNLSDYPLKPFTDLCWEIVNNGLQLSVATFRPDRISAELMDVLVEGGQPSVTIAPECGSDRLRGLVGKRITNEQITEATHTVFAAGITALKDFFVVGLPGETEEDRDAIVQLVEQQLKIAKGYDQGNYLKVDVNPVVPKWHTPLKNWLYYYLEDHRPELRAILIRLYCELSRLGDVRPKETALLEYLAQTWLTHLTSPVNPLIEGMTLDSHVPISRNLGYYLLSTHAAEINADLNAVWDGFVRDGWSITHPLRASPYSDETLTREWRALIGA